MHLLLPPPAVRQPPLPGPSPMLPVLQLPSADAAAIINPATASSTGKQLQQKKQHCYKSSADAIHDYYDTHWDFGSYLYRRLFTIGVGH